MLHIKLAQLAVRCALPPRRSESSLCANDNKPSCVLHLLGWFIGSRFFLLGTKARILGLTVTAQFYLENSRKYSLEVWGHADPKTQREEGVPQPFGSSFCMFFPSPLGLSYVNWAWPGVLFVPPEVLTQVLGPSLDLPLSYFRRLFLSLFFSHRHFGLLFPSLAP